MRFCLETEGDVFAHCWQFSTISEKGNSPLLKDGRDRRSLRQFAATLGFVDQRRIVRKRDL